MVSFSYAIHYRGLRMLLHLKSFCITLIFIVPFSSLCTRHSRIKKIERLENSKKVVISGDKKLSQILSKHSKYMNFEEAVLAKNHYVKERDIEMAIKCGKRALAVGGDQEIMRQIRFELCSLLLEKKDFKETEEYAKEYLKLYPGAADAMQAEYIAVQANFFAQLSSDRDQNKTHATIKRAQEFLEKHTSVNEYTKNVQEMLNQSYQTLIRSEINIIETHIHAFNSTGNQGVLDAAYKRLAYCKEKYLPHAPITKKRLLEIEIQLAKLEGKTDAIYALEAQLAKVAQESLVMSENKKKESGGFYNSLKKVFVEDTTEYFA